VIRLLSVINLSSNPFVCETPLSRLRYIHKRIDLMTWSLTLRVFHICTLFVRSSEPTKSRLATIHFRHSPASPSDPPLTHFYQVNITWFTPSNCRHPMCFSVGLVAPSHLVQPLETACCSRASFFGRGYGQRDSTVHPC